MLTEEHRGKVREIELSAGDMPGAGQEDAVALIGSPGCARNEQRSEFRGGELGVGEVHGAGQEDAAALERSPGAGVAAGAKSWRAKKHLKQRQKENAKKKS